MKWNYDDFLLEYRACGVFDGGSYRAKVERAGGEWSAWIDVSFGLQLYTVSNVSSVLDSHGMTIAWCEAALGHLQAIAKQLGDLKS